MTGLPEWRISLIAAELRARRSAVSDVDIGVALLASTHRLPTRADIVRVWAKMGDLAG